MGKLYLNSEAYGGEDISITPTLQEGVKIADFSIGGITGELFAPQGGGSPVISIAENSTNGALGEVTSAVATNVSSQIV